MGPHNAGKGESEFFAVLACHSGKLNLWIDFFSMWRLRLLCPLRIKLLAGDPDCVEFMTHFNLDSFPFYKNQCIRNMCGGVRFRLKLSER